MKILNSFLIAFALYSKIPMPKADWEKENMKYAICFFPFVGIVQGALFMGFWYLWQYLGFGSILFAAIATLIPLIVSGGIHLDGFADTVDALSSHQSKERKLEILKDPNAGAFAVMSTAGYLILYFALLTEIQPSFNNMLTIAVGYAYSRALSGYSVVTFEPAKESGLLRTFSDASAKQTSARILETFAVVIAFFMMFLDSRTGVACVVASIGVFGYYKYVSQKEFGGITGDLAGYFLQLNEIFILIAIVISDILRGL